MPTALLVLLKILFENGDTFCLILLSVWL